MSFSNQLRDDLLTKAGLSWITEARGEAILCIDGLRGHILLSSPAFQSLSGYTTGQLEGLPLSELCSNVGLSLQRTTSPPNYFKQRDSLRQSTGLKIPVQASITPISFEHQRFYLLFFTLSSTEAWDGVENQYQDLFDRVREGVVLVDNFGKVIDSNKAASDLTGFSKEEFLSLHSLNQVFDQNTDPSFSSTPARQTRIVRLRHKSGVFLTCELASKRLEGGFYTQIIFYPLERQPTTGKEQIGRGISHPRPQIPPKKSQDEYSNNRILQTIVGGIQLHLSPLISSSTELNDRLSRILPELTGLMSAIEQVADERTIDVTAHGNRVKVIKRISDDLVKVQNSTTTDLSALKKLLTDLGSASGLSTSFKTEMVDIAFELRSMTQAVPGREDWSFILEMSELPKIVSDRQKFRAMFLEVVLFATPPNTSLEKKVTIQVSQGPMNPPSILVKVRTVTLPSSLRPIDQTLKLAKIGTLAKEIGGSFDFLKDDLGTVLEIRLPQNSAESFQSLEMTIEELERQKILLREEITSLKKEKTTFNNTWQRLLDFVPNVGIVLFNESDEILYSSQPLIHWTKNNLGTQNLPDQFLEPLKRSLHYNNYEGLVFLPNLHKQPRIPFKTHTLTVDGKPNLKMVVLFIE